MFGKNTVLAMTAAMALMAGTVQAQEPVPVEAFAHLPSFRAISISPDGTRFAAKVNVDEAYRLGVFDYSSGKLETMYLVAETEDYRVGGANWAHDDRLLYSLRYKSQRWTSETVETRLMSMRPDGSDLFNMHRYADSESDYDIQIQDRIVSMLPSDPANIIVQYAGQAYRVPVDKAGSHIRVQRAYAGVGWWGASVDGTIMVGAGVNRDDTEKWILRMPDGTWKDVSHRAADRTRNFGILGVADEPGVFYVHATHPGTGTDALYAYNALSDTLGEAIFVHPIADVSGIRQDSESGRVIGVTYTEDEGTVHWLEDTAVSRNIDLLQGQLSEKQASLISLNGPETHAVVLIDSGNDPGFYILFDMAGKSVFPLASQYPALDDVALGEVFATTYTARDGLEIPAYVTLPAGYASLDAAQGLPFVILPHGGPAARDFKGFDYWAQFLVSRGYGVLQMNFRGSEGYGAEFREAGTRQWGQAMQDDITDGTLWLAAQGYADPNRIAIMGGSYGGYAAMMGAVKTPDLYRCTVSFAGVSNLLQFLNEKRNYSSYDYWRRVIGARWSDRSMLAENSPSAGVAAVRSPVLLVHGLNDQVVDIDQSRRMARALEAAGKQVTLVELPAGDHYLSIYENRLRFLQETERFLGGCL